MVAAVFLFWWLSSTFRTSNRLLSLLNFFVVGGATSPGSLLSLFTGGTVNLYGWCGMWLVFLVVEDVEGTGFGSGAVVSRYI